jgi:hypothetical protein
VFSLKQGKYSSAQGNFFSAVATLAAIPGVRNFKLLRQISPKNEFDFGISMEFESKEAYEGYNNHPEHTRFVQEAWLTHVEKFMELDFEPITH